MNLLAGRFFFPDEQVVWLPFAVAAAVHAAREYGADAILSTSSPTTAHLAAMLASRIVGIPWVADFRDPWVGNGLENDVPGAIVAMRRRLERRFIASAVELTFVTPSLTKRYQKRYPDYAHRMRTVPNGYDRRERVEPIAYDPDHFTLVYAGTLYRPRELTIFLGGLQSAVTAEPGLSDRLRVRFVGSINEECDAVLRQARASAELASIIEVVGLLPREAALGVIQASDAALLLLPDGPGTEINASGKLYDYVGRDRQVLAVVSEGDAAQVLRGLDWGVIAAPTIDGVARGIREVMAARPKRTVADPEGCFDWANLTSLFAAALDRAATSRNGRSPGGARKGADGDS
jgi:glycosyltransferase involved in cell wall biosynthesis